MALGSFNLAGMGLSKSAIEIADSYATEHGHEMLSDEDLNQRPSTETAPYFRELFRAMLLDRLGFDGFERRKPRLNQISDGPVKTHARHMFNLASEVGREERLPVSRAANFVTLLWVARPSLNLGLFKS